MQNNKASRNTFLRFTGGADFAVASLFPLVRVCKSNKKRQVIPF